MKMETMLDQIPTLLAVAIAAVFLILLLRERKRGRGAARRATAKLKGELAAAKQERSDIEAEKSRMELELQKEIYDLERIIAHKDEEIDRIKNDKARLSVKLLGESLEQHCENAFNQVRSYAFPNAEFHKDNDASQRSKGDYIYRERDASGVELLSIMFEMKNEAEGSVNTKKNEDHFKKLDHDRRTKGCEYAVLVSLLEPDSDLYNTGIVDVSHEYPKMFVIRPQFFIPFIGLLRNAALSSLEAKAALERKRQEDIDLTTFEDKLEDLKGGAGKYYAATHSKCESAVKNIGLAMRRMQSLQEDIEQIDKNAERAKERTEDITVRRLTYRNKAMKDALGAARQDRRDL